MEKSKRTCLLSNINISCWQKPLRSFRMRIPVKKAAVFRKDWFMKTVSKCSVVKHYCSQWQFFWISFYLKIFHNLNLDSSNSGSQVMESFYNTISQREEQETRKCKLCMYSLKETYNERVMKTGFPYWKQDSGVPGFPVMKTRFHIMKTGFTRI